MSEEELLQRIKILEDKVHRLELDKEDKEIDVYSLCKGI